MSDHTLTGERILVVEDEVIIALDVASSLRDAGATIVTAPTPEIAIDELRTAPVSCAILDVRLGEFEDCSEICDELDRQRVPFLFHTGYDATYFLPEWEHVPVVRKPATGAQLMDAVLKLRKELRAA